jgi:DNA-directed RNA polymerase subunit M/transcription elongation factor TFIIS
MSEETYGFDWYCDNCGAYLNSQPYFSEKRNSWTCKECGYKNRITADNIYMPGVNDEEFENRPGFHDWWRDK